MELIGIPSEHVIA